MESRWLKYEANQTSAKPERGQVSAINTNGTVDLYTGTTDSVGLPIYLANVPIMGSYTPKLHDWVGISWDSGFPIVMGDITTTLQSISGRIDGSTIIRNSNELLNIVNNATVNYIINSGFELDTGWTPPQSNIMAYAFKDRAESVFGSKCLSWSVGDLRTAGNVFIYQKVDKIKSDTSYCFSFFYKDSIGNVSSKNLRHIVKIEQYDENEELLTDATITWYPPLTTNWSRFYDTFKTDIETKSIIIYIIDEQQIDTSEGVSWQCWYDGVQLEIGIAPTPYNSTTEAFEMTTATSLAVHVNLLPNSSFEYFSTEDITEQPVGSVLGWVLPEKTYIMPDGTTKGTINASIDNKNIADAVSGNSLKIITTDISEDNYVETELPITVNGNDYYTASAMVKATNIPSGQPVMLKIAEYTSDNLEVPHKIQELTWTKIVGTTTDDMNGFQQIYQSFMTDSMTAYIKLRLCSPSIIDSSAPLYWDNVQVQRGRVLTGYNPREIVGTQIANGVITTEHIVADGIDGKVIKAGTLKIGQIADASRTFIQDTPPSAPMIGDQWYDTSVDPKKLRLWDGQKWSGGFVFTEEDSYGINLATYTINNTDNSFIVDESGLLVMDKTIGSGKRLKITSGGIGISNDNGATFSTAIDGSGIYGDKIIARTITTDKLRVGNGVNILPYSLCSFETYNNGETPSFAKSSTVSSATISNDYSMDGDYSLKVVTNSSNSNGYVYLATNNNTYDIKIIGGKYYIYSFYARTTSSSSTVIGGHVKTNDGSVFYIDSKGIVREDGWVRVWVVFQAPVSATTALVCVNVNTPNKTVYFDCLQVEEVLGVMEDGVFIEEPSKWTSSGITEINGGIIKTGSITADKIKARSITADKIAAKSITANEIDTSTLRVGENIFMAPGAVISWDSIYNKPFIPTNAYDVGALPVNWVGTTYINSQGVYTGVVACNQIVAVNNRNPIIRFFQSVNGGSPALDATAANLVDPGYQIRLKWNDQSYLSVAHNNATFYFSYGYDSTGYIHFDKTGINLLNSNMAFKINGVDIKQGVQAVFA